MDENGWIEDVSPPKSENKIAKFPEKHKDENSFECKQEAAHMNSSWQTTFKLPPFQPHPNHQCNFPNFHFLSSLYLSIHRFNYSVTLLIGYLIINESVVLYIYCLIFCQNNRCIPIYHSKPTLRILIVT